jgi:hypothetical protein
MRAICMWCHRSTDGVLWLDKDTFVCSRCFHERKILPVSMRDEEERA